MEHFLLERYKEENTNTKIKVFIEYLYEKFGIENNEFNNEYFFLFNENDLVESLEYYIDKNKVTSQVTANNYITYIRDFFIMLSDEYNIKNETFFNLDIYNRFINKSKLIISKLKKSESKEVATDEQYEALNIGIKDYLNHFDENDLYDEILKYKNKEIGNIKFYYRFLSTIAIKLIMKFAFKNLTVISLELDNLDIDNHKLNVNGLELPLDEELIHLMKTYLRVRKYVLDLYSMQENKLFVKHTGKPFIKNSESRRNIPDYGSFFKIMEVTIHTWSAELFATRRIIEMIEDGIDISTIAKLTDRSNEKLINLQKNINDEESMNTRLLTFFDNTSAKKTIKIKKKGYLECPFCGNLIKATDEEWVLIQFENDTNKYLSCRKCKGKNGNYNI